MPLATTERHFSGPRLTRAREWLGNLGNAVATQDRAALQIYPWKKTRYFIIIPSPWLQTWSQSKI